jgi:hypothetical protein
MLKNRSAGKTIGYVIALVGTCFIGMVALGRMRKDRKTDS